MSSEESLSRWQLDVAAVRERLYRAPTPRERERWHALWLAAEAQSSAQVADRAGSRRAYGGQLASRVSPAWS